MPSRVHFFLFAFLLCRVSWADESMTWSGRLDVEGRLFFSPPLDQQQSSPGTGAYALRLELEDQLGPGYLVAQPFARIDQWDEKRSHGDMREASWEVVGDSWGLRLGMTRTFWGVMESRRVVDIVNQIDNLEAPDTEEKLGQLVVQSQIFWDEILGQGWGTWSLFGMTWFRERQFPGERGRFRFPVLVERNGTFDSEVEHFAPDFAARWSSTSGPLDWGVSYFYGTSREPQFVPEVSAAGEVSLRPHYDRIHQPAVDVQLTLGGLMLKGEAFFRSGQGDAFWAASGGIEYLLPLGSTELSLFAEYHQDERTNDAWTIYDRDVFGGARWAVGDVAGSEVQVGALSDVETGSSLVTVDASRRWGETKRISCRARVFAFADEDDLLYAFRKDSDVEFNLEWFFH